MRLYDNWTTAQSAYTVDNVAWGFCTAVVRVQIKSLGDFFMSLLLQKTKRILITMVAIFGSSDIVWSSKC